MHCQANWRSRNQRRERRRGPRRRRAWSECRSLGCASVPGRHSEPASGPGLVSREVPAPFRIIAFDDLRDAIEDVALVDVSDSELADKGVPLVEEDTLMDGLGSSRFALLELATGEQYLVHRLLLKPSDGVFIVATTTEEASTLADRLLDALDISKGKVTWRVDSDHWNVLLTAYRAGGKESWEARRGRRSGA